jgi:hypothetical protein
MLTVERTINLDSATYSLIAIERASGFHSFWVCETCSTGDYCELHESDEQALSVADAMARVHHQNHHALRASA